jgi:hypothetical protein
MPMYSKEFPSNWRKILIGETICCCRYSGQIRMTGIDNRQIDGKIDNRKIDK